MKYLLACCMGTLLCFDCLAGSPVKADKKDLYKSKRDLAPIDATIGEGENTQYISADGSFSCFVLIIEDEKGRIIYSEPICVSDKEKCADDLFDTKAENNVMELVLLNNTTQ